MNAPPHQGYPPPPPGYPYPPAPYPPPRPPPRSGLPGWALALILTGVGLLVVGGIVAALAVSGFKNYMTSSKTLEATNSLGMIGRGAALGYDSERTGGLALGTTPLFNRELCASASRTVPSSASFIRGKKYMSASSDWEEDKAADGGFHCLRFRLYDPQYFMYGYTASKPGHGVGSTFTATANGDLNGDGVLSTFSLSGLVDSSLELHLAPAITKIDENE